MLILGEARDHMILYDLLIRTFQSNVAAYNYGGISAKLYCTKVSHTLITATPTHCIPVELYNLQK